MKFKYKSYGGFPRPVIQIILKHKGNVIGYNVLVDSGADICFFDQSIGEAIGLDIKSGKIREV